MLQSRLKLCKNRAKKQPNLPFPTAGDLKVHTAKQDKDSATEEKYTAKQAKISANRAKLSLCDKLKLLLTERKITQRFGTECTSVSFRFFKVKLEFLYIETGISLYRNLSFSLLKLQYLYREIE